MLSQCLQVPILPSSNCLLHLPSPLLQSSTSTSSLQRIPSSCITAVSTNRKLTGIRTWIYRRYSFHRLASLFLPWRRHQDGFIVTRKVSSTVSHQFEVFVRDLDSQTYRAVVIIPHACLVSGSAVASRPPCTRRGRHGVCFAEGSTIALCGSFSAVRTSIDS